MGGHNRPYPSLRWVGMDDEQTFTRDTRDWWERRNTRNQGLRVARLSHRRAMPRPIFWPGSITGWRWKHLVDPPDVLGHIARELIRSAVHKQSDVTAALATCLNPAAVARVWAQQTAWRKVCRIDGDSVCRREALIRSALVVRRI
jgi:hypothetical protein